MFLKMMTASWLISMATAMKPHPLLNHDAKIRCGNPTEFRRKILREKGAMGQAGPAGSPHRSARRPDGHRDRRSGSSARRSHNRRDSPQDSPARSRLRPSRSVENSATQVPDKSNRKAYLEYHRNMKDLRTRIRCLKGRMEWIRDEDLEDGFPENAQGWTMPLSDCSGPSGSDDQEDTRSADSDQEEHDGRREEPDSPLPPLRDLRVGELVWRVSLNGEYKVGTNPLRVTEMIDVSSPYCVYAGWELHLDKEVGFKRAYVRTEEELAERCSSSRHDHRRNESCIDHIQSRKNYLSSRRRKTRDYDTYAWVPNEWCPWL